MILDNVIHVSNAGFFSVQNNSSKREKCITPFVSGKEISLQGNHPLFLTWHLGIDSESVAGSFWTGHLFSRIWVAADSKAISCSSVICATAGFPRNLIVFSWLLMSLRRLESGGDEVPAEQ